MVAAISPAASVPPSSWQIWTGRVLTALPALAMTASGAMKVSHAEKFLEGWKQFGFQESQATPVGVVELLCVVLYLVPKTRVLGAILVAAYLGGAVVTHVRAEQSFLIPLLLGVFAWGGLFLRDARLRALLPLVKGE